MTIYARFAPTDGTRIFDDTTCTVGTATVPVPLRTALAGRLAPHRICAALDALGYHPAGDLVDDVVFGEGWFNIPVVPLDGA
jgi:hypothetical protein